MDSLAHVNNVQFARLIEEARVRSWHEWFAHAPQSMPMMMARQDLEFVDQLRYDNAPARIEIWVTRLGEKSVDYGYRLWSPDGRVCALAESTGVAVDPQTRRPTPIPDSVRAVLEKRLGEPVPFRRRK